MRTLDYFVVALYLAAIFAVGIASRGRKHNVDEYFAAHGTFKGPLGIWKLLFLSLRPNPQS